MANKLVIFGAGNLGREVYLNLVLDINRLAPPDLRWDALGFIVEPAYLSNDTVAGLPILGTVDWLKENPDAWVILAVESPSLRKKISEQIRRETGNRFATLVHPSAQFGPGSVVGEGSIVSLGNLVSIDVTLGQHVLLNACSIIGHDAVLGDFVTVSPSVNVSGNVDIGTGAVIGTGVIMTPQVRIGAWTTVCAGSVVSKDLPPHVTAAGYSAKIISRHDPGTET